MSEDDMSLCSKLATWVALPWAPLPRAAHAYCIDQLLPHALRRSALFMSSSSARRYEGFPKVFGAAENNLKKPTRLDFGTLTSTITPWYLL